MTEERGFGEHIAGGLIGSFALLIGLLGLAVYISIQEMSSAEYTAEHLLAHGRATARLIETIHREEDSLNAIFYKLAAGGGASRQPELIRSLDDVEKRLNANIDVGMASDPAHWQQVRQAAGEFLSEGRRVLKADGAPGARFYEKHEALSESVASLATATFDSEANTEQSAAERFRTRLRYTVTLLVCALLVAAGGAALTVYATNRAFERMRWQSAELSRLSSRVMSDLDAMARRFSHELHDQFGQTLNAIEANLVVMRNRHVFHEGRIEDCLGLIKDGISSVRELSQLLRPSILDDFGWDASLRWLTEGFAERTGIQVQYTSSFTERMNTEAETQIFRIAQEALTNIGRHSGASEVRMNLRRDGPMIHLEVADNGRGFEPSGLERGLGLVGMRARARTAKGLLVIKSKPGNGAVVNLEIPFAPEAA